jgi:two-component system, NarL family, invasion response regulator UvrY
MEVQNINKRKVVLIDDHVLLRNGLASLVRSFDDYTVLFEANNGQHFMEQLDAENLPDIVLMDINMPVKDGFETTLWLKQNFPYIKVLALSMYDNEHSIIRILKNGAKGYILKDTEPKEFKAALDSVFNRGYYYSDLVAGKLIHAVNNLGDTETGGVSTTLNEKEIEFIKLACTELTYKEIADKMFLSPRTIDGYRDDIFEKLDVKTRVGLVMYAIKTGIVNV